MKQIFCYFIKKPPVYLKHKLRQHNSLNNHTNLRKQILKCEPDELLVVHNIFLTIVLMRSSLTTLKPYNLLSIRSPWTQVFLSVMVKCLYILTWSYLKTSSVRNRNKAKVKKCGYCAIILQALLSLVPVKACQIWSIWNFAYPGNILVSTKPDKQCFSVQSTPDYPGR